MTHHLATPSSNGRSTLTLFVLTFVVLTVGSVHIALQQPFTLWGVVAGGLLCSAVGWLLVVFIKTRRRRAHFFSGDSELVAAAVQAELREAQVPPAYVALGLAGVGDFTGAGRALLAHRTSIQNEDEELVVCTQIIVDSFEGRNERALSAGLLLAGLPLSSECIHAERRRARRVGVAALARVIAGVADEQDYCSVTRTPTFEPVLYWVCRYGVALGFRSEGSDSVARGMLKEVPDWPQGSFFAKLQRDLVGSKTVRSIPLLKRSRLVSETHEWSFQMGDD